MSMRKRIGAGLTLAALLTASAVGSAACGQSSEKGGTESAGENGTAKQEDGDGAPSADEKLEGADYKVDLSGIKDNMLTPGVVVHDPSIIKEEKTGTYYIFGSHMAAARTKDLAGDWEGICGGYNVENPIYTDLRNKKSKAFYFSGTADSLIPEEGGGTAVWAPDVKYNPQMGKYVMYYCTNSNFYTGTICWATSEKIDGEYEWQGNLVYSGYTKKELDKLDVLKYIDRKDVETYHLSDGQYNWHACPHAIDPTVFWDKDGRMWMVYGSWSGGIYILEINPKTGEVIRPKADFDNGVDPYFGKYLMGGNHESIEGPYILYDKEADYYYLYVSYGSLTANGGYQIRVFRSKNPDGEYVDMNGKKPEFGNGNQANYGLKLSGNYRLPSLKKAYKATGHNSAMIDDDGKRLLCYHTRFEQNGENHSPRVKQYFLNKEGWPCLAPYATAGETLSESGYDKKDVVGRYYIVNQGKDISGVVAEPMIFYLTDDGKVFGEQFRGTWSMEEGTPYAHIRYTDVLGNKLDFSGVLCRMKDEAGTEVMTFSGVGDNCSLWGVKYDK